MCLYDIVTILLLFQNRFMYAVLLSSRTASIKSKDKIQI